MLHKKLFLSILPQYPDFNLDLFARRINKQLDNYVSWNPDPEYKFVDAFSINWKAYNFYVFPPYRVSQKKPKTIENDLLLEFQCLALN